VTELRRIDEAGSASLPRLDARDERRTRHVGRVEIELEETTSRPGWCSTR
jgi:hypothetical protein